MQEAVAIDPSLVRAFEERIMDPWWRLTSGHLYRILTKDNPTDPGSVVPFLPNDAQLEYFSGMWYRNVIPKSRQLGITTAAGIYLLDHALFVPDQRCGLIAHTKPDAEAIFRDKVKFAYENLPAELRALMPLKRDASEELLFAHNNSSVRVSTSMRSQTIHRLHVSEFGKIAAKYPERATEIISGALPAVPLTGRATIESTAEGASGRFHDICQEAKAIAEKGGVQTERDWKLFFFAWWTGRENRMSPAGVTISPKDHEYFDKVEGEEGCKLDLWQRAWYVATRDKQFSGDQTLMWREEPSTFAECFQQSSEGAYFANELARARAGGRIVPSLPVVTTVPCHTFWDIGNSDGTAVWVMQRVAPEYRFIRFVEGWGEGYGHFVQKLQEMGFVWGTHYLPHDANHERQGAHRPWKPIDVLRDLAPTWRFEIVPPVNELIQGIQAVRQVFPECWFDETHCKEGLAHLSGYVKRWNTAAGHWMDEPVKNEHTEAADAFRQFAQAFKNLQLAGRQTRPNRRGSEHML